VSDAASNDEGISPFDISWSCRHTWRLTSYNTLWCLVGCSIGDLGTILYFQTTGLAWPVLNIMVLAIINGLITSIALETVILSRLMSLKMAFRTAIGMSFISMISMEAVMNMVDFAMTGGAILSFEVILPMLIAGYVSVLPYNYWRLKAFGIACH